MLWIFLGTWNLIGYEGLKAGYFHRIDWLGGIVLHICQAREKGES